MARRTGRGHRLRRALAQAQARGTLDDRALRRRLSEIPGRSAGADPEPAALASRNWKPLMIRHRLLLTFLFAFSLGVIAAVYLVRHQHDVARDLVLGETATATTGKSRADPGPDSADNDDSGDKDDNEDSAPPRPDEAATPEQVMYAQARRMDEAIAKL